MASLLIFKPMVLSASRKAESQERVLDAKHKSMALVSLKGERSFKNSGNSRFFSCRLRPVSVNLFRADN